MKRRIQCLLLVGLLLLTMCGCGGTSSDAAKTPLERTAAYLMEHVSEPTVSAVGGDWTILALCRSGLEVPQQYLDTYYQNVTDVLMQCQGQLDSRKYTEYSRVSLALRAMGKDPADVAGYSLLEPLGDFDKTIWQGVNSPIWALIALDSGCDEVPENPAAQTQATRQMYLDYILEKQLDDGGWTLAGSASDPDMTAMALQALSNYTDQPAVQAAVERGLQWLSQAQDAQGGYTYLGVATSESVSQVIVALTSLGISLDDSRFVKNGCTVEDNLLTFQLENGSFAHAMDGTGENIMATEQAFYALVAIWRAEQGMTPLYRMEEAG